MKALVTGGGGFLGKAIVALLVKRGDSVRSIARGATPGLAAMGVESLRGNIADAASAEEAVRGVDVVFHAAAKAGVWGDPEEYRRSNVVGTRNVLAACRTHGVRRLVFTSSPSVVFDGRDMEGVDESVPYPERYKAPYSETKAEAERAVLAANGPDLATVALRPHLVWGPGDNHLVPRIVERARQGRLFKISGPPRLVDSTYVDNAAEAHVLAADRLGAGLPPAGRAYFISNGEPMPVWELVDRILAAAGLPPLTRTIPPGAAYAAGCVLELAHRVLGLSGEPRLTRFLAEELSTSHWFDLTAARRDLGYEPKVSIAEGLRRLALSLRQASR
ncbi:MAG: NAD-dependent epimerase/dehydratase family protein [Elusimicrobia bacterium]|nr:NAD-dependent epimerase/dehydratase family protein [Elusimicrobiota bacterium]